MQGECRGALWTSETRRLAEFYLEAKLLVIERGYASEIDWQQNLHFDDLSETALLRESAWAVLSSGLSEKVVSAKFTALSGVFCNWNSSLEIWENRRVCRSRALSFFNSPRKIDAILTIAGYLSRNGFMNFRRLILTDGIDFLTRFPMLGPATGRHLAKNLGLPTAKPDRHLVRIARALGNRDVVDLCTEIACVVGDPISVIDIVLWRYATLVHTYPDRVRQVLQAV